MYTCMCASDSSAVEEFSSYFTLDRWQRYAGRRWVLESNLLSKEIKRILRHSGPMGSKIGERGHRQQAQDSENSLGLMSWVQLSQLSPTATILVGCHSYVMATPLGTLGPPSSKRAC